MYCSLFRVDDEMLVTPHVYGRPGRVDTPDPPPSPPRAFGLFTSYLQHFEDVFYKAASPLPPTCRSGTRPAPGGGPWWDLESRRWIDDE